MMVNDRKGPTIEKLDLRILTANTPSRLIGQGNKRLPIRSDPAGYCLLRNDLT